MNPQLTESLYVLVNASEWRAYMQFKQARLDELHRELEWQTGEGIPKAQGRIAEIRADLELHKRMEDLAGNKDNYS